MVFVSDELPISLEVFLCYAVIFVQINPTHKSQHLLLRIFLEQLGLEERS